MMLEKILNYVGIDKTLDNAEDENQKNLSDDNRDPDCPACKAEKRRKADRGLICISMCILFCLAYMIVVCHYTDFYIFDRNPANRIRNLALAVLPGTLLCLAILKIKRRRRLNSAALDPARDDYRKSREQAKEDFDTKQ